MGFPIFSWKNQYLMLGLQLEFFECQTTPDWEKLAFKHIFCFYTLVIAIILSQIVLVLVLYGSRIGAMHYVLNHISQT